ncbi:MAG: peptide deformylase [Clostridiales bacterium]|jgi:peptide deformylase|nr:peptide deformylase [Eubacteriales bacterium]MDH7566613.1 peptide deformylase [Clostridiales bacterium]
MAIRVVRKEGDEVLRKKARPVEVLNEKILILLKDMAETMYNSDGIGLAAPQIGILKRMVVIDVGEGLIELINPKIVEEWGEQVAVEGCLSIPGIYGEVKRPAKVVVEAINMKGEKIALQGEELLARALCHEIDHLDGILFTDKVIRYLDQEELQKRNKRQD